MKLYFIVNWALLYESAETRKLENLRFVLTPNKHDGLGFRRMAAQREQCQLFAAWNLIVQLASKGRRSDRGKLMRDGRPLEAEDLALMTGFPQAVFERALEFFSDPKQGWLGVQDLREASAPSASVTGQPGGSPEAPAPSPEHPGAVPDRPGDEPGLPGINPAEEKGREEKRNEGEGRGAKRGADDPPPPTKKGQDKAAANKAEPESENAWLTRLQGEWPRLDVVDELRKAMKKKNGKVERKWFVQSWLKNCDEPVRGVNGRIVEPEPEGWKVHLKDEYSGESWAESAAMYGWAEMPDAWRGKICRGMRAKNGVQAGGVR